MATAVFLSDTGPSTLPAVGKLEYNGCVFGPLFETSVHGAVVKDNAGRTTKFMEYDLRADGYVTLNIGQPNINPTMDNLRRRLTQQGGALIYKGRGFDLDVNTSLAQFQSNVGTDVAWGPTPELVEFQPLGGGRSAKVQWRVKVRIPEQLSPGQLAAGTHILQFNYDTTVNYLEDGYSTATVTGTMEISLTRDGVGNRRVRITADDLRGVIQTRILSYIDLARFRITHREFTLSRDKRTIEWKVTVEEKPYMDLPPDCTIARGTYTVRPAKVGAGLINWLCTLRATYNVRRDRPRRTAWIYFLALLRRRMMASQFGDIPAPAAQQAAAPAQPGFLTRLGNDTFSFIGGIFGAPPAAPAPVAPQPALAGAGGGGGPGIGALISGQLGPSNTQRAFLIDFGFEEGLYLDSKTISFHATWRLITRFSHILRASGLWIKVPERNEQGGNHWALSMTTGYNGNVQGSYSWLKNIANPSLDAIVDFGGP